MGSSVADSVFERAVFIIGAGHSYSAGAPLTSTLTDWIVDGSGPLDRRGWSEGEKDVLSRTRDHLGAKDPSTTYESIFTWLWTRYFSDDPTMYRVAYDSQNPLSAIGLGPRDETAYSALPRIEDGVQMALADERLNVSKTPELTLKAVEDPDVRSLTLITLNHDRLLESCLLQRAGLDPPYDDGFEGPLNGRGRWDAGSRSSARNWERRVQLIKIHGSIDWWSPSPWNDGGLVYRDNECPTDTGCTARPLFLVGTGPKLFQSSNLAFARQILDAGYALARATCVITVGYGFGDVRVNSLWSGASSLKNRDQGAPAHGHKFPTLAIEPKQKRVLDRLRQLDKRAGKLDKLFENPKVPVKFLDCEAENARWDRCKEELADLRGLCK
jgi:hypothetical protein